MASYCNKCGNYTGTGTHAPEVCNDCSSKKTMNIVCFIVVLLATLLILKFVHF